MSKVIPPTCQNFHAMYTYKAQPSNYTMSSPATFAVTIPDYAYLQLELIHNTLDEGLEMDLICWKILLTKAMAQFMGTMGESIPTDIIHILNPASTTSSSASSSNTATATPRRRRHSYNNQQNSRNSPNHNTIRNRSNSHCPAGNSDSQQSNKHNNKQQHQVERPQVWIRVPESDLTTVWTALSGFYSSLDTGNYGVIDAGIRVVRASRYLMSTTGPLRSKW